MEIRAPLRYQISSWDQLPDCLSNNSKELHLHVTNFIQDARLCGKRITIEHDVFGVLFAVVVDPAGSIVSQFGDGVEYGISTNQILSELARYGFLITYKQYGKLPGDLVQYLMTLIQLKFDKIRILNVWDMVHSRKEFKWYVVAFKIPDLPQWLNSGYAPSKKEFLDALESGNAINLSVIGEAQRFDWSWLYNWVADIGDIIEDNAGLR